MDVTLNKNNEGAWLSAIRSCVNSINKEIFTLSDIYKFKDELELMFPNNSTIESSIRARLQDLRDLGEIEFIDNNGTYKNLNYKKE